MPRPLSSVQTFLLRPGLLQDLEAFCQGRGYAGLVTMTVSFNERHEPTRKLAVYSPQEPLRSTVSQGRACPGSSQPQNLLVLGVLERSQPCTRSPAAVPGAGGGHDAVPAPAATAQPLAPRGRLRPGQRRGRSQEGAAHPAGSTGGPGGCGGPRGGGGAPTHPHEQPGGGVSPGTGRAPAVPPGCPGAGQPHRCGAAPWLPKIAAGTPWLFEDEKLGSLSRPWWGAWMWRGCSCLCQSSAPGPCHGLSPSNGSLCPKGPQGGFMGMPWAVVALP